MSPCDFHLFCPLRKHLQIKRFKSDDELKDTVEDWLFSEPQEFWEQRILRFVKQWGSSTQVTGDCFWVKIAVISTGSFRTFSFERASHEFVYRDLKKKLLLGVVSQAKHILIYSRLVQRMDYVSVQQRSGIFLHEYQSAALFRIGGLARRKFRSFFYTIRRVLFVFYGITNKLCSVIIAIPFNESFFMGRDL